MADTFDPYSDWLGMEGGRRPPDHYCLLGLKQFESDPESIARAADAASAKVRRVRPGAHLAEWSQLLDRIAATKACLLDPASREAYDADLRAGGRPPPEPVEPTFVAPPTPASEVLLAEFDATEVQPLPITPSIPASSGVGPIVIGLAALAVVAAGLFIYTRHQQPTARPEAAPVATLARPPAPAPSKPLTPPPSHLPQKPKAEELGDAKPPAEKVQLSDAKPQAEKVQPVEANEVKPPAEKVQPEKPKPPAEKLNPAADGVTTAAFARAVSNARTALADRDLAAASRHVKRASDEAQTPEDHDQVDRLETMLENLAQFWNGIRASMVKLQAAEEIVIGDTRIVVVDSNRNGVTVKAEGRVHRFRIETMPTSLVMALARQNFGQDAGSKAVIATFLAVDPQGDRELARRYWQEAGGAGIDCQKLLPELDAMPPVVRRPGRR